MDENEETKVSDEHVCPVCGKEGHCESDAHAIWPVKGKGEVGKLAFTIGANMYRRPDNAAWLLAKARQELADHFQGREFGEFIPHTWLSDPHSNEMVPTAYLVIER